MEEKNYKELTHRMYCFFKDFTGDGLPSFSKFARSEKMTLERLKSYRENPEFDRIFRECKEIRRDMMIDKAFTRRGDGSFAKFLIGAEDEVFEDRIDLTLTVID